MINSNPNKTLVFIHVPKTAGSTLHAVLENEYEKLFTINGLDAQKSIDEFCVLDQQEINSFQVIKGHLAMQVINKVESPVTLTYLRNPVDRVISSYHYIKRASWNRFHEKVNKLSGLEDFVDFAIDNGIDNTQTRHLSNSINGELSHDSVKMIVDGHELLQKAIENINNMDYVFHTHQFDESLLILKKELKWSKMPYYIFQNKTLNRPKTKEQSGEIIDKIIDMEKFDIALFNHSKELNDKLMAKHNISQELRAFGEQNLNYQKRNRSILKRVAKRLIRPFS